MIASILLPLLGAVGELFKIQHWPMAWVWNSSASLFSIIMLLIVARKVLRYPGFKDFLDQ